MSINLMKGQKISLTKDNPALSQVKIGLGWDVKKYDGGHDFDLDASVFMCGANGKCRRDSDFIFYGNKSQQYRQVGNAVPPMLGQVVAEALIPYLKNGE